MTYAVMTYAAMTYAAMTYVASVADAGRGLGGELDTHTAVVALVLGRLCAGDAELDLRDVEAVVPVPLIEVRAVGELELDVPQRPLAGLRRVGEPRRGARVGQAARHLVVEHDQDHVTAQVDVHGNRVVGEDPVGVPLLHRDVVAVRHQLKQVGRVDAGARAELARVAHDRQPAGDFGVGAVDVADERGRGVKVDTLGGQELARLRVVGVGGEVRVLVISVDVHARDAVVAHHDRAVLRDVDLGREGAEDRLQVVAPDRGVGLAVDIHTVPREQGFRAVADREPGTVRDQVDQLRGEVAAHRPELPVDQLGRVTGDVDHRLLDDVL